MVQFYFLSVLMNFIAGFILISPFLGKKIESFDGTAAFFQENTKLIRGIGIGALVMGVLKFIFVFSGSVPVVGDFLPALAGIAGGSTLLLTAGKSLSAESPEGEEAGDDNDQESSENAVSRLGAVAAQFRTPLGFVVAGISLMHLLFPGAIFL